ncbi:MAG TPA: acyl-CoA dehydrogenase family protein [Kofleriaceae bacterium]
MDFAPTEEQLLVQSTARDAAERILAPKAAARDISGEFPLLELRQLASLGLMGVNVPDNLGGSEAGAVAYVLAMIELAAGDASVAVAVSVTNMVAELIATQGSPELAAKWVPRIVGGDLICGAFGLSEPEAGSDPVAMRTTAVKQPNGNWRINGTKQWITSGDRAGAIVVWAVTDPTAEKRHQALSAFVVDVRDRGLTVARLEDKMGLHGSSTAQLVLDNVEVPADAILGREGQGFALAMLALEGGRIGISAQAIGIARSALQAAVRYAQERQTFGQPIIKHQAIAFMLADAATWLDASTLMTLRAAQAKETGQPYAQLAAMAKLFSTEHAWKICDIAMQVHGGYGYVRDFPVERHLRDVRVTRIYEGTSEIQRIVIARNLLRGALA